MTPEVEGKVIGEQSQTRDEVGLEHVNCVLGRVSLVVVGWDKLHRDLAVLEEFAK